MNTSVGGDKMLHVAGTFHEHIQGDFNSETKKDKNDFVAGKNIIQSENGHEFHADNIIKNNSGEGTRQN